MKVTIIISYYDSISNLPLSAAYNNKCFSLKFLTSALFHKSALFSKSFKLKGVDLLKQCSDKVFREVMV